MEAFEEAIAASKEQSLILKGKREKRQRSQSPVPFSISPPIVSCPSRDVEEEYTNLDSKENALANNVGNHKKDGNSGSIVELLSSNRRASSSASWSSNNNPTLKAEEDEEDLDIASCLILHSQGHSLPQLKIPNHETNNNNTYKFSSRRFLETSSSNGGGKACHYVYQCKTCDRTFSSFQALGGHRASHKKRKATSFYSNLDHLKKNIYENDSLATTTTIYNNSKNRSLVVYGKAGNNKVHECRICGAEFTAGQALGGHMRRHRGAVVVAPTVTVALAAANTELSLSSMSFDQISTKRAKKMVVSLDLDLNLPAPEDENRVNGFSLYEPKCLVLSPPTLVDCHY
ncbi:hypothetical protein Bca52824_050412 [Brassica carinata]|uniref:C2H2-type domain-containing protein n=1 Tax=Brassica carinata TaxID=52824 RepID=A0A8X7R0G2_BRACI|nr:hypothetical protein Bca52824_050412 [Brassica carinata]